MRHGTTYIFRGHKVVIYYSDSFKGIELREVQNWNKSAYPSNLVKTLTQKETYDIIKFIIRERTHLIDRTESSKNRYNNEIHE